MKKTHKIFMFAIIILTSGIWSVMLFSSTGNPTKGAPIKPADPHVVVPDINIELNNVPTKKGKRDIKFSKNFGGMKKNIPDTLELNVPLSPSFDNDEFIKIKVIIEPN